jgi:hypothetical protein
VSSERWRKSDVNRTVLSFLFNYLAKYSMALSQREGENLRASSPLSRAWLVWFARADLRNVDSMIGLSSVRRIASVASFSKQKAMRVGKMTCLSLGEVRVEEEGWGQTSHR